LFILISTKDETSLNREGLSEVIRNKWISDRSYTKKKKMSPTLFYYRLGRTLIWYKKKILRFWKKIQAMMLYLTPLQIYLVNNNSTDQICLSTHLKRTECNGLLVVITTIII